MEEAAACLGQFASRNQINKSPSEDIDLAILPIVDNVENNIKRYTSQDAQEVMNVSQ